VTAAAWQ
jgi:hypothetical protein